LEHGTTRRRDVATEVVSPELVLVDPELARRVRALPPPQPVAPAPRRGAVPVELPAPPAAAILRLPPPAPPPDAGEATPPHLRVAPFAAVAAAAVIATTALTAVGALAGDGSLPVRAGSCAFADGSCRVPLRGPDLVPATEGQAEVRAAPPVAGGAASAARPRVTMPPGAAPAPQPAATPAPRPAATPAPKPAPARRAAPLPAAATVPSRAAASPAARPSLRLAWAPVRGASFYGVRVARLTDGASVLALERYPSGTGVAIPFGRLPPGRYVWEAWAVRGTRASPVNWSQAGGGLLRVARDGSIREDA
jgi:hypothetical protein